ncbi:DMT family transporter [Arthrobacter sp. ISL-48]|uniref:DMT family transporter n=1 Tax=Arthrobacter sp. ISL-48 TaxID=2819110 RepID=UPI001BEBF460|nr:DMT family transporter [Arthrobacter sp. ISL-48]MBT2533364.1 DMT family transporter [Arthrobacter sp. ISL-48]
MNRSTSLAAIGGLATAMAWGGMFTIAKTAFSHLGPFQLTAARFIVATVVFMAILALKEGPRALIPGRRAGALWLLGTIGFTGFNMLMYAGLAYSAPQTISLVMATLPMVTLFVLWARTRKRPGGLVFLFSAVALVGVAMVLGNGNPAAVLQGGLGQGVPLTFAGVVAWVIYTTSRSGFAELSMLRFTAHTCLLGTLSIIALTSVLTWNEPPVTVGDVVAVIWQILYMALPATVLAVLTWNQAVAILGASNGVLFINLVPITAFTIEAIRGHQPTGGEIAGVALTLAALLAVNLVARRTGKGTPPVDAPEAMAALDERSASGKTVLVVRQ